MTSIAKQPPARSLGRPRSARAHQAILDATIDLFVEQGYQGMSIEGVAARAGVGKTTIYRRWTSKGDLILDAIEELLFDVHPRDTGSLRDDLADLLVQLQTVLTSSRFGEVFPRMVPEIAAGSPLGRAWLEQVIEPRFAILRSMLRRGVDRGELPKDVDLEVARAHAGQSAHPVEADAAAHARGRARTGRADCRHCTGGLRVDTGRDR